MRSPSMRPLLLLALLGATSCEDNGAPGGSKGESCTTAGYRCATPACSAFPLTPGCDDVAPENGNCPIDHPHCFDPSKVNGYCHSDPAATSGSACVKARTPLPEGCPATPQGETSQCLATIQDCFDVDTAAYFCRDGAVCVSWSCADGGVPADGGQPD